MSREFRIGVSYGTSCVGCCWTLMLVLFALSVGNVLWIFALTAVMALEKTVSFGPRLVKPVGVSLVALGIAAFIGVG